MSDSEAVVRRMRHIWCCKGAEFARPELQAGWVEIERLAKRNKELERDLAKVGLLPGDAAELEAHFIAKLEEVE